MRQVEAGLQKVFADGHDTWAERLHRIVLQFGGPRVGIGFEGPAMQMESVGGRRGAYFTAPRSHPNGDLL